MTNPTRVDRMVLLGILGFAVLVWVLPDTAGLVTFAAGMAVMFVIACTCYGVLRVTLMLAATTALALLASRLLPGGVGSALWVPVGMTAVNLLTRSRQRSGS